jgi:hypothetical protein
MHGRNEKCIEVLDSKTEGKRCCGINVDGRIILGWILGK